MNYTLDFFFNYNLQIYYSMVYGMVWYSMVILIIKITKKMTEDVLTLKYILVAKQNIEFILLRKTNRITT